VASKVTNYMPSRC